MDSKKDDKATILYQLPPCSFSIDRQDSSITVSGGSSAEVKELLHFLLAFENVRAVVGKFKTVGGEEFDA